MKEVIKNNYNGDNGTDIVTMGINAAFMEVGHFNNCVKTHASIYKCMLYKYYCHIITLVTDII